MEIENSISQMLRDKSPCFEDESHPCHRALRRIEMHRDRNFLAASFFGGAGIRRVYRYHPSRSGLSPRDRFQRILENTDECVSRSESIPLEDGKKRGAAWLGRLHSGSARY